MSKFTSGKYGRAICDRCGDKIKYTELRTEWTGLKVCSKCLDPKTALEFPTNFPTDPEALRDPRVDNDVEAGNGMVRMDKIIPTSFSGFGIEVEIGEVTVTVS